MAFQYKKARRENTHLLIGLAGASGSGKTYSAMQLATGICGDQPFALLDTEGRRGLHYADQFDFEHVELGPPFTPTRYLEKIKPLEERGFRAIVLDSGSHEWEGEGGLLEQADESPKKSPGNWIEPKRQHRRFVNGLLQYGTNLIVCLRAAEKIHIDDSGPKIKVINEGIVPICEKRFMFEMTTSCTLSPLAPGVVNLELPHKIQDQHRMAFPPGQHISVEAGRMLGQWARGDVIETPDKPLWDRARQAAHEGMKALRAFSEELSPDERAKLKPIKQELLAAGNQADKNLASDPVGEGEFITEDKALDLQAMLSEREIDHGAFLKRIGAASVRKIRVADHQRAIHIIEEWV